MNTQMKPQTVIGRYAPGDKPCNPSIYDQLGSTACVPPAGRLNVSSLLDALGKRLAIDDHSQNLRLANIVDALSVMVDGPAPTNNQAHEAKDTGGPLLAAIVRSAELNSYRREELLDRLQILLGL
jgi:hypothetical protein